MRVRACVCVVCVCVCVCVWCCCCCGGGGGGGGGLQVPSAPLSTPSLLPKPASSRTESLLTQL